MKVQPLHFLCLCLILTPAIVLSQPASLVERVLEFQVAQNLTPPSQVQIELLADLETPELVPASEPDVNNQVAIPISGAYVGMNTGDAASGISVAGREQLLGHNMAIERIFYGNQNWTLDRININRIVDAHNSGRIPMVSYKVGAWRDVLNGSSDAIIDTLARQIKDSGIPILLTFHHEPDNNACANSNPDCGKNQTAEDFVAMWRYIHNRFAALDVNNVSWNWNVICLLYTSPSPRDS